MQQQLRENTGPDRETPAAATGASPIAGDEPWRVTVRNLAIAAGAGVFLAFAGAMGTSELSLGVRLAYWVPLIVGGSGVAHLIAAALTRLPRASANPWVFGGLLTVLMTFPITLIVWAYSTLMIGAELNASTLPQLFGSVLVICTAMTAIMVMVNWPGRVTHAPPAGAPAPAIRFMERLPAKLRGAVIYAVSSEDHYLRLHTSKGADLILMRLIDAIGELEGLEGAQTHRSWWVAREAVESSRREGDRVTLVLKGGIEAPVSRPNIKPLRDAGWF